MRPENAPGLAVVLVGSNRPRRFMSAASAKHVKKWASSPALTISRKPPAEAELLELIGTLNADKTIDGILKFQLLPAGRDRQRQSSRAHRADKEDVDGFHPTTLAACASGRACVRALRAVS